MPRVEAHPLCKKAVCCDVVAAREPPSLCVSTRHYT